MTKVYQNCDILKVPMVVIRRPRQYTSLVLMLLVSPAVFLLNIWVMHKGAIAKVLTEETYWWLGIQAAWAILTTYWLMRLRWRGFLSFLALAAVILGMNTYSLITTRNYALAFYGLFVLILSVMYAINVFKALKEAYYNSGQRWFEGGPRFIPRVQAEVRSKSGNATARLSRLGAEGCYAYPTTENVGNIEGIVLKLGDLQLDCKVELISRSRDGLGQGLKFVASSPDQDKDIRDFIDRVRSSGYVT